MSVLVAHQGWGPEMQELYLQISKHYTEPRAELCLLTVLYCTVLYCTVLYCTHCLPPTVKGNTQVWPLVVGQVLVLVAWQGAG